MSTEKKKVTVATTDDLRKALAAGHEASQIEIDNSAAIATARAEGVAEGKAANTPDAEAIRKDATAAERKRIGEVQALARKGFDAELKAAIDNGDSAEKFAYTLLKAANERGITLEAIKRDAPPAAPHAKPADDYKPKAAGLDAQSIYAARRAGKE
jgi:hypothetical protein